MVKLGLPRRTIVALLLAVVSTTSCNGDYAIRLPGGYSLVRIYSGTVVISHPDIGIVVEANVDGYAVVGSLVVGHVSLASRDPEQEFSKPGYFVLNTRTHETKQSLDKAAWLESLRAAGILGEPKLNKPSRSDKNYS